MAAGGIRWLRVLVGSVLAHAAVLGVGALCSLLPNPTTILLYALVPLCLGATFVSGFWAARGAQDLFVVHGLLVGILTALASAILSWRTTLPTVYVVANCLKMAGGAAGGWLAAFYDGRVTRFQTTTPK
jgi:hypothetical protein